MEIGGDTESDTNEIETPLVSTNFAPETQWTNMNPKNVQKRLSKALNVESNLYFPQ